MDSFAAVVMNMNESHFYGPIPWKASSFEEQRSHPLQQGNVLKQVHWKIGTKRESGDRVNTTSSTFLITSLY